MDSDNGWVPGKWGKPGHLQTPSNVTRIARAVKSEDEDHHPQIVYYQAGIGTGIGLYDQLVGGGTGMGLAENIREAYAFLAANFAPHDPLSKPDQIFLLGFSRGAFTARSLGGFIGAMGILTKKAQPHFYECFMDWERAGDSSWTPRFFNSYAKANPDVSVTVAQDQRLIKLARDRSRIDEYLREYRSHLLAYGLTQEVDIQAIGVWDTVGALGIPINPVLVRMFHLPSFIKEYRWFDTRLDVRVKNAFQALAMDEHRAPYSPAVWELNGNKVTNLKQTWFAGAHSNIGGSYADTGSANLTLAWMMDQLSGAHVPEAARDPRDWIAFDQDYIDLCFKHATNYYNSQPDGAVYRGWGMGKLFNSCTFPQSLAGKRVRTPGRYHETDYDTGNYTSQLLENTHEHIHASVRVRIARAGRGVEPSKFYQKALIWLWRLLTFQHTPSRYDPTARKTLFSRAGPLFGWALQDAASAKADPRVDAPANGTQPPAAEQPITWQYHGKDTRPDSITVLPEDTFAPGGFEQRLLQHDQEAERQVFVKPHKGLKQMLAKTF